MKVNQPCVYSVDIEFTNDRKMNIDHLPDGRIRLLFTRPAMKPIRIIPESQNSFCIEFCKEIENDNT